MYKRILAAVDQSPRSRDVVRVAAELAQMAGASVRLYRAVVIPPDFPAAAANVQMDPLPEYLENESKRELEAMASSYADVRWEVVVEPSPSAWRAILAAADALDADLIVVGSHGYDLLDRLLGTTAAKVANASLRDVYVVHRRVEHGA
jgi:universal stress protein F